jgi:hypothetical protein
MTTDDLVPERSSERFHAVAMLACAVICFNMLGQSPW